MKHRLARFVPVETELLFATAFASQYDHTSLGRVLPTRSQTPHGSVSRFSKTAWGAGVSPAKTLQAGGTPRPPNHPCGVYYNDQLPCGLTVCAGSATEISRWQAKRSHRLKAIQIVRPDRGAGGFRWPRFACHRLISLALPALTATATGHPQLLFVCLPFLTPAGPGNRPT